MSEYVRYTKAPLRGRESVLERLDIELTERCNNNCIHCSINLPEDDEKALSGEMKTKQIKKILDDAVALNCMQVRFTGGEPLLRGDFEELYVYARKLGLKVLLFSNVRLVTLRLAKLFAEIPPLLPIEITVYGMSRESYEAVTGIAGSYEEFRRGVDFLLEQGVPFIVKFAVLPQNVHEIGDFEGWADSLPGMTEKPNYVILFDLRNRHDDPVKNKQIVALRVPPKEGAEFIARSGGDSSHILKDFTGKYLGPPGDLLFRCSAGRVICVDAYGSVQPCMGLRMPDLTVKLSCLKNGKLEGICEKAGVSIGDAIDLFSKGGEDMLPLKSLRAKDPEYLKRCARCFLKGLCEQCPAKSWAEHGTLDTPVDYLCEITHERALLMGLLKENEKAWSVHDWEERVKDFIR